MNYTYRFPVVKGVQAKRDYYIAMVPLRMLPYIFMNGDGYVLPEYRAQRKLNESRIPIISKYIIDNRDNYVFSALAASIDGAFEFHEEQMGIGILEVSMDARFLINDGQHRKAAILEALEEDPSLGEETISVVLYEDQGLARSQQIFTDLNKHAVKTSNSIAELYDSRDALAVVNRNMISRIEFLNMYVDKEKDILGKYSSSLFTLSIFYNANKKILGRSKCDQNFENFIYMFWNNITANMIPWMELANKELTKKDLREQFIATQAVVIQAFGRVGAYLYKISGDEPNFAVLKGLQNINWRRNADCWKLRAIRNDGRLLTGNSAQILIGNVIKMVLNLPMTYEEEQAEQSFKNNFIKIGE